MASLTITSANAVYMLAVSSVFPTPQQLQGFAVDEAFDTEQAEINVTQVGVDGVGVAGWVPREIKHTIVLLPSSNSRPIFEQWVTAMDNIRDTLYATATIVLPSLGLKYACQKGSLTRYPQMPGVRRVLQPVRYEITWLPDNGLPAITLAPQ